MKISFSNIIVGLASAGKACIASGTLAIQNSSMESPTYTEWEHELQLHCTIVPKQVQEFSTQGTNLVKCFSKGPYVLLFMFGFA